MITPGFAVSPINTSYAAVESDINAHPLLITQLRVTITLYNIGLFPAQFIGYVRLLITQPVYMLLFIIIITSMNVETSLKRAISATSWTIKAEICVSMVPGLVVCPPLETDVAVYIRSQGLPCFFLLFLVFGRDS